MSDDGMTRAGQVIKSIFAGHYGGITEQEIHETACYGVNRHQRRKALAAIRKEAKNPEFRIPHSESEAA
jgi:hypothetical protein